MTESIREHIKHNANHLAGDSPTPVPVLDTDRLKSLAAYLANTAEMLEVKLGTVGFGALFDLEEGLAGADVRDRATGDRKLVESAKQDAYHLAKAAIRAIQHLADPEYCDRVGDPTATELDPSVLLYRNGIPVTTDVIGSSAHDGWQPGLGGVGRECAAFTRIMTPHPAAPHPDLNTQWTTSRTDVEPPKFNPRTGQLDTDD